MIPNINTDTSVGVIIQKYGVKHQVFHCVKLPCIKILTKSHVRHLYWYVHSVNIPLLQHNIFHYSTTEINSFSQLFTLNKLIYVYMQNTYEFPYTF